MQDRPFQLRPFRGDEVDELRKIERSAHRRYARLPNFEKIVNAPAIAPERFSTGETVVAEQDGVRLGYVLAQPLDGMTYIASIMVDDGCSGRGVGSALLEWVEQRSVETGSSAICLTTFKTPPWNGPWFRRHGFEDIPQARIGPGLQAILDRHATFLDMATRDTLWKPVSVR